MKRFSLLLFIILANSVFAQTPPDIKVTVSAKGADVRVVLHDLFGQAKLNFIIDPKIKFSLYLSLTDLPFEQALNLVCDSASVGYDIKSGVYHVAPAAAFKGRPLPNATRIERIGLAITAERTEIETVSGGAVTLSPGPKMEESLAKIISLNAIKMDLRQLCANLTKQSGTPIRVDPKVPGYKLDVTLKSVSLKEALTRISKAASLNWAFTNEGFILLKIGSSRKPN